VRPYEKPLALEILRRGSDAIARFMEVDPFTGYELLDDTFRYVLGYYEPMFNAPEPDAEQRAVAHDLWIRIDPTIVARRLSTVSRRQLVTAGRLLNSLHEMAP
jgi:hypothetical protein